MTTDRTSPLRVFISYAHVEPDRSVAERAAGALQDFGYVVEWDEESWSAGDSFVDRMNQALAGADVVLALWSPAYFDARRFTGDESRAVVAMGRQGLPGTRPRFVPVWISEPDHAAIPPMWRHLIAPALGQLTGEDFSGALISAVRGARVDKSAGRGHRLSGLSRREAGTLPDVWRVAPRSRVFSGRDELLTNLRTALGRGRSPDWIRDDAQASGNAPATMVPVIAVHGLGGVGKTLLAVEFAYRFSADYDVVWWVEAEQAQLIDSQFAELSMELGRATAATAVPTAAAAARAELRGRDRWLIVLDNAGDPTALRPFIPDGPGHVLITSRNPAWAEVAEPIEIDVFDRAESVALLQNLVPSLSNAEAVTIHKRLDGLPLALAQAGGVMTETGMPAAEYLAALDAETTTVLNEGKPATYRAPLAAAVRLAHQKLMTVDPAAADLIVSCAFLAPETVPLRWFAALVDEPAKDRRPPASRLFALRKNVGAASRLGLVRLTKDGLLLHRLTAEVLRDRDSPRERAVGRSRVEDLIVQIAPAQTDDPSLWQDWGDLMPHLAQLDPANSTNPMIRTLGHRAVRFQLLRGEYRSGQELGAELRKRWSQILGPDHPDSLLVAHNLAMILYSLGEFTEQRQLLEDTFSRQKRVLGENHPDTLHTATTLAGSLLKGQRDPERAREIFQDTLIRQSAVLGAEDPDTLRTASNLSDVLAGDPAQALLDETFSAQERILGRDHPDTLFTAERLAWHLRTSGDLNGARTWHADTLDRRRRVLGEEHPDTLSSMESLAFVLYEAGEFEAAHAGSLEAFKSRRRILGPDHLKTLDSAEVLAPILWRLGDIRGARDLQQDTLARRRKVLAPDHPDTLESERLLAELTLENDPPNEEDQA